MSKITKQPKSPSVTCELVPTSFRTYHTKFPVSTAFHIKIYNIYNKIGTFCRYQM